MEEDRSLAKQQLLWTKITGIASGAVAVILIVALILAGGFMRRVNSLVEKTDRIAQRLESATAQLEDINLNAIGKDLEKISDELSKVNWGKLTDDINSVAVKAEESLKVAQKAITDLDIETLNEAIKDLRDVVEPLANLVNRFKN
jgi:archaellum component FlaC